MIESATTSSIQLEALTNEEKLDFFGSTPFFLVHAAAVAALFTGISWPAIVACLVTFWVRMFGITAGYHRYFCHHSFATSRIFQFTLAFIGASAAQNGPLWWASHHRIHHRFSDTEDDVHSPGLSGLWWSHAGWILCRKYVGYDAKVVKDLARYPELRFIGRYHMIAPVSLAVGIFFLGAWLEKGWPGLGTSGWQMLGWGFFVSTVLCYHITFLVNSAAHTMGRVRFNTGDNSRNNWWVALLTLGEGWHNNHHRWPASERQGMYWWEIDVTHYILKGLSLLGIVWDIKEQPARAYAEAAGKKKAA